MRRPGAVADPTGWAGAPEGPARAHSRGAAPAARPVVGGRCRDRAFGVSLAGFGALAIRGRTWTASPALVSRRRTLDSLLGGNTSKGSTCDAANDRPWRTTDDRACHFARDDAHNSATKRRFAVRRPSIRFRALWACLCRLLGFRARDARGSVHDRSFGAVGWLRRHRAGRSRQWLGAVPAARVWAARPSPPRTGGLSHGGEGPQRGMWCHGTTAGQAFRVTGAGSPMGVTRTTTTCAGGVAGVAGPQPSQRGS